MLKNFLIYKKEIIKVFNAILNTCTFLKILAEIFNFELENCEKTNSNKFNFGDYIFN